MSTSTAPGPRERLLAAAVEYLAGHGVGDLSLRDLAAGIGTSHRMLIYHFGSKEQLLVAVVRAVEDDQRRRLAELADEVAAGPGAGRPSDLLRRMWAQLTEPGRREHQERLFFELYAQALAGRPGTTGLLDGVVDLSVEAGAQPLVAWGMAPDAARSEARLGLAVVRGLLLDLLATGDHAGTGAALDRYAAHLDNLTDTGPVDR
jgi:AcrR family transcriptional regulator